MVEVRITYETLFDLLRREKSRNELQDLDQTFFVDVVSYLREKQASLSERGQTTIKAEQEKVRIQIKNIKRILSELYELREKKILNLALNKTRTGSSLIDTSKMLIEERKLFEEATIILSKFRSGVLDRVSEMELPSISSHPSLSSVQDRVSGDELSEYSRNGSTLLDEEKNFFNNNSDHGEGYLKEDYDYSNEANATGIEERGPFSKSEDSDSFDFRKKEEPKKDSRSVNVRFLTNLPKFIGLDKGIYGPFEKGDIKEIPEGVAELLLKKGRIQLV